MNKNEYKTLKESIIRLILESIPAKAAREMANKVLEEVIKEVKKAGVDSINKDYNDYLYLIEDLREEGITVNDIKWYYGMDSVREWMFCKINNIIRTMRMTTLRGAGLSTEEAIIKLRKSMPIFGERNKDILKSLNLTEEDDNLPSALQRRVNLYVAKCKEQNVVKFRERLESFSTFNSFIRNEIRAGKLYDFVELIPLNEELEVESFKSKIKEQEDQLFGIRLYCELINAIKYDKNTLNLVNQHYKNIKERGEESITRARELLKETEGFPDLVEYLRLFQFPPIHGYPMLEEMTDRAKILIETYNELFPGQPKEKTLTEDEKRLLLETATDKWEP